MKDKTKLIVAGCALVVGAGLITWNLRDPDRGFYEQPKQEQNVTLDQIPAPVRATIKRESAGGVVEEIQKETQQGEIKYEVDLVVGGQKIDLEIAEDGSILERKTKKLKPSKPS